MIQPCDGNTKRFILEYVFRAGGNGTLRYIAILLFALNALGMNAQMPMTMKDHWMFVDVALSHQGRTSTTKGLIDTGASVCVIDSTFAVDFCHIRYTAGNTTIGNTSGKRVNAFRFDLDSLTLSGTTYTNICCYVLDLVGKMRQYAPKFIIGGDLLKRDVWGFDLKQHTMTRYDAIPTNIKQTFDWKNHDDYSDASLNSIYLKGEIAGKKTRLFFDTGSRDNELPENFKVVPTKIIEAPTANIADEFTLKKKRLCEHTPIEIGDTPFHLDFILTSKKDNKYPRINAAFLSDETFLLDYKNKRLYIVEKKD